jgi:hypothetical protein
MVVQLHRALVDALIMSDKHNEYAPVTVAEIYQDLIPYRSVRMLGFAMNADYEHALLQLLAGEHGLAQIEPPEVREALQDELNSPNPNVGIYRNYAACDVIVTVPDEVQVVVPAVAPPRPEPPKPGPAAPAKPSAAQLEAAFSGEAAAALDALRETLSRPAPTPTTPRAETPPSPAPRPQTAAATATSCGSCKRALPANKPARFCPYCGADQKARRCAGCGEKLEEGWKFCIACGSQNP